MPDNDPDYSFAKFNNPTREIGSWIAEFNSNKLNNLAIRWAKHAVLDWFGVTLAGTKDPLVDILASDAVKAGETGPARLIGRNARATTTFATLINGAASHALDYDDVNQRLHGHPTVPIVPAILAIAEQNGASGRSVLEAFVVGYEVECLIGEMMGLAHYDHGWHATATVGTFGAAAGAARLLGLSAEQASMALGIAATQAAGLKSMFGTMCKPLHAGKAAMNGLMAARWAGQGFTSRDDVLECAQGFGLTQSTEFKALPIRPNQSHPFAVEENLFKYHAACYLIHSSIEAVNGLKTEHNFKAADVTSVRARVDSQHRKVCDILEPRTGLEIKFSLRHCVAMALSDLDTSDRDIYTDELANREDLIMLRQKVELEDKSHNNRYAAEVVINLNNGTSLMKFFDVGTPANDIDAQEARLADKFLCLASPIISDKRAKAALEAVNSLETAANIEPLMILVE